MLYATPALHSIGNFCSPERDFESELLLQVQRAQQSQRKVQGVARWVSVCSLACHVYCVDDHKLPSLSRLGTRAVLTCSSQRKLSTVGSAEGENDVRDAVTAPCCAIYFCPFTNHAASLFPLQPMKHLIDFCMDDLRQSSVIVAGAACICVVSV